MRTKTLVIAEAGSNWRVSEKARVNQAMAMKLVDAAAAAGADAVKFQTFRADQVYVANAGASGYLSKRGIRESITELFARMAMPYDLLPRLAQRCRQRRIRFLSSAFSEQDFRAVDPYVRMHKIASYEITYPRLLELAARSGKPLLLSTGASAVEDIDWAVRYFRRKGGRRLTLLQCTAAYPAPEDALNLKTISFLRERYGVPVGFSDHSRDPLTAPIAAVTLGAVCIEKHFTLDNRLPGPDHAHAVTAEELKDMVRAVRACERMLGTGVKAVLPAERELHAYAQRAVQAVADIRKGERLLMGRNIAVLRPGRQPKGMHPRHLEAVGPLHARRAIVSGRGIRRQDVR